MKAIKWFFGTVAITAFVILGLVFVVRNANAFEVKGDCKDILAPNPETFEADIKPGGGVIMATYKWFEEPVGTWTLKMDIDPRGDKESWVSEYPRLWFFGKPVDLPQTIVEYTCPSKDKTVTIVEDCDGTSDVTIYGGDTRRTWSVNGDEKWVERYATVVWEDVTSPAVVEWWHENSQAWKPADSEYVTLTPAEDCEVPQLPEEPKRGVSEASAPQCTNRVPVLKLQNPHVIRNGSDATVNSFVPEGDRINIYFRTSGQPVWQHALRDVPVTNGYLSVTIHDLQPFGDYDFGIQASNGCAGSEVVLVIVDDYSPRIFTFSHWERL